MSSSSTAMGNGTHVYSSQNSLLHVMTQVVGVHNITSSLLVKILFTVVHIKRVWDHYYMQSGVFPQIEKWVESGDHCWTYTQKSFVKVVPTTRKLWAHNVCTKVHLQLFELILISLLLLFATFWIVDHSWPDGSAILIQIKNGYCASCKLHFG